MRILWTVNYLPKEIVNSVFPLFSTHSGGNSQWLRGKQPTWRDVAISEYDYSVTPLSKVTGVDDKNARLYKRLAVWGRRMSQRITRSSTDIQYMRVNPCAEKYCLFSKMALKYHLSSPNNTAARHRRTSYPIKLP